MPLQQNAPPWQLDLQRRGQLNKGDVLLQDPMRPGTYVSATEADWQLAISKGHMFTEICQLLGARKVAVKLIHESTKSGERTITMAGEKPATVKGRASLETTAFDHLLATMALSSTFAGGPPDTPAARDLLRQSGSDGDPNLKGLVDASDNTRNPPTSRDITVNLSTEATRTLNAAAKIGAPMFFSLDVNVKQIAKEATTFSVEYLVTF